MKKFTFEILNNYKNNGQNLEQSVRKFLTGKLEKADNIAYNKSADCLNYQIKSARATVCKGTDLKAYLALDASTAYIYATKNGIAYIMSRETYIEFCETFGTITRDSTKNGGQTKIRLGHETKALIEWLNARA